jgi:acetyl esterase/lipase
MKLLPLLVSAGLISAAGAQDTAHPIPRTGPGMDAIQRDIPYAEPAEPLQTLDVYAPPDAKNLPVVVWIHGGGWQMGDKAEVREKPAAFAKKGFVFVSVNYRLMPKVTMGELVRDVAKSVGWVHQHVAEHGGDPQRLFIMGHSAGAQLAALLCTDERYLQAAGVPLSAVKGCVPVDGDTYDVPAMIATEEMRRKMHGLPEPKFGHRQEFGDLEAQKEFSAVNHVAKDKGIPPFLLLHVAANPETTAQALHFAAILKESAIPAKVFGSKDTDHSTLNNNLGLAGDPATKELFDFVDQVLKP